MDHVFWKTRSGAVEYLQKQQNQNRMLIGQLSGNPGEGDTEAL